MSGHPDTRPVYMIGIAAELAGMHPQTLRVYERRGLVNPRRSARNTRMYSDADVALLLRIQELSEEGMNLAGIQRVLSMEAEIARLEARLAELEADAARNAAEAKAALREQYRSLRGEIVHVSGERSLVVYDQRRRTDHRRPTESSSFSDSRRP